MRRVPIILSILLLASSCMMDARPVVDVASPRLTTSAPTSGPVVQQTAGVAVTANNADTADSIMRGLMNINMEGLSQTVATIQAIVHEVGIIAILIAVLMLMAYQMRLSHVRELRRMECSHPHVVHKKGDKVLQARCEQLTAENAMLRGGLRP